MNVHRLRGRRLKAWHRFETAKKLFGGGKFLQKAWKRLLQLDAEYHLAVREDLRSRREGK